MIEHLRTHDVTAWRTQFLRALRGSATAHEQEAAPCELPVRLGSV
jgi:hypothetical protein